VGEFAVFTVLVAVAWQVAEAVREDRPWAATGWMMGVAVALAALMVVHQLGW
jgi:hypothetical protein